MRKNICLIVVTIAFSFIFPHTLHAAGEVRWKTPEKIEALDIFKAEEEYVSIKNESLFYHVGTMTDGKYAGGSLMIAHVTTGPFADYVYHIIQQDAKVTLIKKYSADPANEDYPFSGKVGVDASYKIQELEFPKTIKGPKQRQILTNGKATARQFAIEEELKKVFTHSVYGNVYADKYGFFFIKIPSGQAISYEFKPDFSIRSIKWNPGQKKISKENDYTYKSTGGCGESSLSVASLSPDRAELKKVGVNAKGDQIYFMKNANSEVLKAIYAIHGIDERGFPSTEKQAEKKVSYKKFLSIRPAFFWVDPFGRLITYQSTKLVSFAECGKPVIYLYPQTETDVRVLLKPNGGFTKTEPFYKNGWFVRAQSDGTLIDHKTGKRYPYLFWEGHGTTDVSPHGNEGFIVARNDIHSFLEKTLAKLGLNERERLDFEEFWEPRMNTAPYYSIAFHGNHFMNELAPLSIMPKPDTIIRIFMDFTPLEYPRAMNPQKLVTPVRRGFTVIEWGGVLR